MGQECSYPGLPQVRQLSSHTQTRSRTTRGFGGHLFVAGHDMPLMTQNGQLDRSKILAAVPLPCAVRWAHSPHFLCYSSHRHRLQFWSRPRTTSFGQLLRQFWLRSSPVTSTHCFVTTHFSHVEARGVRPIEDSPLQKQEWGRKQSQSGEEAESKWSKRCMTS